MQVDIRAVDVQFGRHQPAHPDAQAGCLGVEDAGVGHHDQIGAELVPVGLEQLGDVRRSRLLLALDKQGEIDGRRGPPSGRQVRAQPEQVHRDVALVVAGAAAVQHPVDDGRVERRVGPALLAVGGLDVVVAVDQHAGRIPVTSRPVRPHGGQRCRVVPHLRLRKPGAAQQISEVVGAESDVVVMFGVGADRRDPQPAHQVVQPGCTTRSDGLAFDAHPPDPTDRQATRRSTDRGRSVLVEAQPAKQLGVTLPFLGHRHVQAEVDPGAEQLLDLRPSALADGGEPRTLGPDHDSLL